MLYILLLLSSLAHADPPFFIRGASTNQSVGAINQNAVDQTTQQRDRLTTTQTPKSCPAGQALTGAFFNNGYTFGGSCSNVISSTSTPTSFSSLTVSSLTVTDQFIGNNVVHMSSCSYNFTAVGPANGNLNIGFSTVSITIPIAMRLRVWYSGSIELNATGQTVSDSFLLDGGYDTGLGITNPIVVAYTVGSGLAPQDGSYSWVTSQQNPGAHSVSFTLASPGTGIPHACKSTAYTTSCQFCVEAVQ